MRRVFALLPLLLVFGCASAATPGASPSTPIPTPSTAATQDPIKLVGLWTVTDAKPDPARPPSHTISALRLGSDLIGFAPCGEYDGTWVADPSGGFLADSFGGSGSCFQEHPGLIGLPTWLRQATGYRLDGVGIELLDARHHVVARLTPGADVGSRPDMLKELTLPPTPDATLLTRLKAAVVPPGSRELKVSQVVGRWLPAMQADQAARKPAVTFRSDGSWQALGCNGGGGRWLLEPGEAVLITSGPTAAIGCPGLPVGRWVGDARSMRLDDGALQLYDIAGDLLGTLIRG
jgi:hypothetical protein